MVPQPASRPARRSLGSDRTSKRRDQSYVGTDSFDDRVTLRAHWRLDFRLIIEYRERQHEEPGPKHWNKPMVSGVPRDEQRRKYDELRDVEIPARGLRLVIITPSHLDSTSRGRRRKRDRAADLEALRAVLVDGA